MVVAAASPAHNAVVSRASSTLMTVVNSIDTAPLQVKIGQASQTITIKQGEKVSLPVKLLRNVGAATAVTVRPQALPGKVQAPEVKIEADKADAVWELTVAADAAVGFFTFWSMAETRVKWRSNPQALEREERYLAAIDQKLSDASIDPQIRSQLEAHKPKVVARLEDLKKQTAEQEYPLFVPSNAIKIEIMAKE
jgi:hypothetical protein